MTTRIGRAVLRAALGPVLEGLEHRRLLVSWFEYGTWTISLEAKPEEAHRVVLELTGKGSLRAIVDHNTSYSFPLADVRALRVTGGAKDDALVVRASVPDSIPVTVNGLGGNDKLVAGRSAVIVGGEGDDTLKGSSERDELSGGEGDDLIYGKGGADEIFGGGGDDRMYGGADKDEISGGLGDDQLFGGTGGDELGGGHGLDHLAGAAGADTLHGNTGDDTLRGGGDGDWLDGGFDDDIVLGQRGADTLRGGLGVDRMVGGADGDTVHRERDVDWLRLEVQDTVEDEVFEEPLMRSDDAAALKRMLIDEAVEVWAARLGSARTPGTQWRQFRVGEDGRLGQIQDPTYSAGVCGYFMLGEYVESDLCGGGGDDRTNVQEQDVDEADLVKTDGTHLYVAREGELLAIDATRAGEPRLVSRTEIGGEVLGLYLRGTTAVVLSQAPEDYEDPACVRGVWFDASPIQPGSTCEVYVRRPRELNVWVLDVSEPSAPVIVERTRLDGVLLTSRMVDGRGYLVVHNSLDLPGPRRTWHEVLAPPADWGGSEPIVVLDAKGEAVHGANPIEWHDEKSLGQIKGYFLYETEAEYRARLETMSLEELVPGYETFDGEGAVVSEGGLVEAGRMHFSETERSGGQMYGGGRFWNLTSVVTIDLEDDESGPVGSTSVAGFEPGTVYASSENLWLTRPRYDGGTMRRTPIGSRWAGRPSVSEAADRFRATSWTRSRWTMRRGCCGWRRRSRVRRTICSCWRRTGRGWRSSGRLRRSRRGSGSCRRDF
jgi:hypothetical protein